MLSDLGIVEAIATGKITIAPWQLDQLQPCSYDVTLADRFLVFPAGEEPLDCKAPAEMVEAALDPQGCFTLLPGEFALAATVEMITLADDVAARIEGKSSLARRGLAIHSAGFIDAGFSGAITLELANLTHRALLLWPGMAIGQLAFFDLDQPAKRPYGPARGSHYQFQDGPTPSAVHHQLAEIAQR